MGRIITANINDNLYKWIQETLKNNNSFRNRSHLVETALNEFRENKKINFSNYFEDKKDEVNNI
jgi:Arc/MetJ-type ribon-helix-helix transcriptional regulator